MGLYAANPVTGILHGEAPEVDRKLREGDNLAWRGDPRLRLQMGILTAKRSGFNEQLKRSVRRGDILARRYEVWRFNEDGTDTMLGHWRLEEFDRILLDMVAMDPRTPGHVPVGERLEKAEKVKEKEVSESIREVLEPMLDHQLRLAHDINEPLTTFRQVGGLRDNAVNPAE